MKNNKAIFLFAVVFSFLTAKNSISQNFHAIDSLEILLEQSSGIEKAKLIREIGDKYLFVGLYQKAIPYYKESLEISLKENYEIPSAYALQRIGEVYSLTGNYDNALDCLLKSLIIFEKADNKIGISKVLNGLGITYSELKDYEKALEYYLESYEINIEIDDIERMTISLNNIGTIYETLDNYDKALEYYQKAYLLMEGIHNPIAISSAVHNIGYIYFQMQEYDTALYYLNKSLQIREKCNSKRGIAFSTYNIANLYLKKNDLASAEKYLDRSFKLSKEIDAKILIQNNYFLYIIISALKADYNNLQKYNDLYFEITETIYNERSSRLIADIQTKYETEKKEQHIEMLNIENKLKETQLQSRTYWLLIFIIAFALVFIFTIILVIQKRNLLFANRNLVKKNLEIDASERNLFEANTKLEAIINRYDKKTGEDNEKPLAKYAASTLSEEQKQSLKSSIVYYMNSNKNYLNIDYSINTLAKDLDVSRSYISQVINELFNRNFSNFLNEYRIKEAKKILSASSNLKYTIESIAEMVGYKSKTAFNNAFKKHVGVTPSFYLNYIKNEPPSGTE